MPLYEYLCSNCNKSTELLQKISDAPATQCPHCHQDKLTKQMSSTSFQLKGTGWYVTDFRNKKESGSTKTETATPTKTPEKTD